MHKNARSKNEKNQVLSLATGENIIKAFWILIVIRLLWLLARIMEVQLPDIYNQFGFANLYNAMMVMTIVSLLYEMRWIYMMHIDLREMIPEYRIRSLLASFLFLPFIRYVRLIGQFIVFGYLIHRIRQDASKRKMANSLNIWFYLFCVVGFAINYVFYIFLYETEPSQLILTGIVWGIIAILDGVISIKLIRSTGEIIKRLSEEKVLRQDINETDASNAISG